MTGFTSTGQKFSQVIIRNNNLRGLPGFPQGLCPSLPYAFLLPLLFPFPSFPGFPCTVSPPEMLSARDSFTEEFSDAGPEEEEQAPNRPASVNAAQANNTFLFRFIIKYTLSFAE